MVHILIAEDDANIRMGLVATLESEAYRVSEADDGEEALALFEREHFDLVLLDVMMPKLNGYDVCRRIRSQNAQIPILMLTAKGQEMDKVVGLKLGADDYITKPFGLGELLARIAAALRRGSLLQDPGGKREMARFSFGDLQVDAGQQRAFRGATAVALTRRELDLLHLFAQNPGQVLTREFLLDTVWGMTYEGTTRTLDQHMAQLRKKIEINPGQPRYLTTVHGSGYRYEP